MKLIINVLLTLLLPVLIIGHVTTDIRTFEYVITGFVILVFIANLIMFLYSFKAARQIPLDALLEVREIARKHRARRNFGFLIMCAMTFVLFIYVNSFVGTLYLLACLMLQASRINVLSGGRN